MQNVQKINKIKYFILYGFYSRIGLFGFSVSTDTTGTCSCQISVFTALEINVAKMKLFLIDNNKSDEIMYNYICIWCWYDFIGNTHKYSYLSFMSIKWFVCWKMYYMLCFLKRGCPSYSIPNSTSTSNPFQMSAFSQTCSTQATPEHKVLKRCRPPA